MTDRTRYLALDLTRLIDWIWRANPTEWGCFGNDLRGDHLLEGPSDSPPKRYHRYM
jgi:hypothetical protein